MAFKKIETPIKGLVIIEPTCFEDSRGFFLETFHKESFRELGIENEFIQDNHSKSSKGVLRGLHIQTKFSQAKLVRATSGSLWDVAVDLREGSPTYGESYGVELTSENKRMFFIPRGFAHGFLSLEDNTEMQYKCDNLYAPLYDGGVFWADKELGVDWRIPYYGFREEDLIISDKDRKQPTFKEFKDKNLDKKVWIIGANGQLGSAFERRFKESNSLFIATKREEVDITDFKRVEAFILENNFKRIINTTAYNFVDKAEDLDKTGEKEKAEMVNSLAVENLALLADREGIEFITYSTDFVFDGKKRTPYTEEDLVNPLSVYGKTKLDGENRVLNVCKNALVLRVSWVYGGENSNFFLKLLEWYKNSKTLKIASDIVSSPTYVEDIVDMTLALVKKESKGLFHISNDGECSRFEQAKFFFELMDIKDVELIPVKDEIFNLPAKRPMQSKISSRKAEIVSGVVMPHWKASVERYVKRF